MTVRRLITAAVAAAACAAVPATAVAEPDTTAAATQAVEKITGSSAGELAGAPQDLREGLTLAQDGLSMTVTPVADNVAKRVAAGKAVYADARQNTDIVMQRNAGNAQLLTVLNGPDAPAEQAYDLGLPVGAELHPNQDGSVSIASGEQTIGHIAAPWATDANGKAFPTRYTVEGNRLVQHVDHAGAAYPVVADPSVSFGWFIYVTFTKAETKAVADYAGAGAVASTVCGMIPHKGVGAACGVIVGFAAWEMAEGFKEAAASNRCARMSFTYPIPVPAIPPIYAGTDAVPC